MAIHTRHRAGHETDDDECLVSIRQMLIIQINIIQMHSWSRQVTGNHLDQQTIMIILRGYYSKSQLKPELIIEVGLRALLTIVYSTVLSDPNIYMRATWTIANIIVYNHIEQNYSNIKMFICSLIWGGLDGGSRIRYSIKKIVLIRDSISELSP